VIRIHFLPPSALPATPLAEAGMLSATFLQQGAATFAEAAQFVHQMPYGANRSGGDSLCLFADGQGTCLSKHGLIARLALELGLPVERYEGFFPLSSRIIDGADAVLAEYGLPFVPRLHCFLHFPLGFVDLTAGNATGKNCVIEEYLRIVPVPPEQTREEQEAMYAAYCRDLCAVDERFARYSPEQLRQIRDRCGIRPAA
jgi:hypothetical protein